MIKLLDQLLFTAGLIVQAQVKRDELRPVNCFSNLLSIIHIALLYNNNLRSSFVTGTWSYFSSDVSGILSTDLIFQLQLQAVSFSDRYITAKD